MMPADILDSLGFHSPDFKKLHYKYTSCETFQKILTAGKVRFSSPDLFEDTYELTFDRLDPNLSDEEYQRIASKYVELTPSNERPASYHDITKIISKDLFLQKNQELLEEIRRTALIFCSTTTPFSRDMWEKYSNKSKGVCFGFYLESDDDSKDLRVSKKVKYTDQLERFKQYSNDDIQLMISMYNWVFTKQLKWKFEDEVRTYIYQNIRYLERTTMYEDLPFNKKLLVKLYYGNNCNAKDIENIDKLIGDTGYLIDRYKIDIDNITGELTPIHISS